MMLNIDVKPNYFFVMKKKNLFITTLLASSMFICGINANAQVTDQTSKNHYYELNFRDNWYISGAVTGNYFIQKKLPGINTHKWTVGGALGVGKWLTPYTGLRLEIDAAPLKMWNQDGTSDDWVKKSVGYMGFYGDFTWNLSNTFWGYNPRRVIDVIPFAGVSFLTALKKNHEGKTPWCLPPSAGVKVNFRISHYVDAFIQDRFTFAADNFNGRQKGDRIETLMTLSAGVSVKLGKNRFIAYNPYEQALLVKGLNGKINQLRRELDICEARKCPEPKPCPDCPPCKITSVVRFKINSSKIAREQQVNVYNAAEWMKQHKNSIVEVVGYADKDTGTASYNMDLSQRRAQAVADQLIKTYKIDPKRIKVVAKGSTEQPYPDHNDWNRVVLFVNEK